MSMKTDLINLMSDTTHVVMDQVKGVITQEQAKEKLTMISNDFLEKYDKSPSMLKRLRSKLWQNS